MFAPHSNDTVASAVSARETVVRSETLRSVIRPRSNRWVMTRSISSGERPVVSTMTVIFGLRKSGNREMVSRCSEM